MQRNATQIWKARNDYQWVSQADNGIVYSFAKVRVSRIDFNVDTQEPFEKAQIELLGQDHAVPMIAFGTLKKKAAFKLYARAQNLDFNIANRISGQIEQYDEAVKNADDEDERSNLNIYDFVDPQYHEYLDRSKPYWGIISDKKKAPSAYLLYSGSIRREIGLIKCKSESTKREYITTVIDGAVAENYKFLKNDILIISCLLLVDRIYERIGIAPHTVPELTQLVECNDRVWDIYADGLTMGVNQCEKQSTTKKVMAYRPRNISELSAFIAGIRPGFKSMYARFEHREPFSYGIPALDNAIQTRQFPYSYILYQENLMAVLNLAGFPMDRCYGIIKAIAKKHPEKVRPLKAQFISGMKAVIADDCPSDRTPDDVANEIWQIVDDSTRYGFNASHAYCMALDSLYCAYLKAYYPYEFYEVLLQTFSDKGKKDKVAALKQEMKTGFGIREGEYRFGLDNRAFRADKTNHVIYPSLLSLKGMSQRSADDLYNLAQHKYRSFFDLWKAMNKTKSLNSARIRMLVQIDYFKDFGKRKKLLDYLDAIDMLYGRLQFPKDDTNPYIDYIRRYAKTTDALKRYTNFDSDAALQAIWNDIPDDDIPIGQALKAEHDYLGYCKTTVQQLPENYYYVVAIDGRFANKWAELYGIHDGQTLTVKVRAVTLKATPICAGDIVHSSDIYEERKWSKDADGNWVQSKTDTELVMRQYTIMQV